MRGRLSVEPFCILWKSISAFQEHLKIEDERFGKVSESLDSMSQQINNLYLSLKSEDSSKVNELQKSINLKDAQIKNIKKEIQSRRDCIKNSMIFELAKDCIAKIK